MEFFQNLHSFDFLLTVIYCGMLTMLTGTEIVKGSLSAATNSVKPLSLWGSSLKLIVFTHPISFLAVTGSALVCLSAYHYTSQKLNKRKA